MRAGDITLNCICQACPEAYDAIVDGRTVGYLRLRHGNFTVDCPDTGGERILEAHPEGDGLFASHEREKYLGLAKEMIAIWHSERATGLRTH